MSDLIVVLAAGLRAFDLEIDSSDLLGSIATLESVAGDLDLFDFASMRAAA